MNAVWNVEDMTCAIVTPVGMLCVAVTVLLVVVTNGLLTVVPGYPRLVPVVEKHCWQ